MRNISIEQCYVPTKLSYKEEKEAFHDQLDAVCGPISSAVSSLAKHCLNSELCHKVNWTIDRKCIFNQIGHITISSRFSDSVVFWCICATRGVLTLISKSSFDARLPSLAGMEGVDPLNSKRPVFVIRLLNISKIISSINALK